MMNYKTFRSQLTSIMEALTMAAMAEICELMDDSHALLQLEISQSHKENKALKRKLELFESIITRGQRENILDHSWQEASGPVDVTSDQILSAGIRAKQLKVDVRKTERVAAIEMATVTKENFLLSEEVNGSNRVFIKVEPSGEEPNGTSLNDKLLLIEDDHVLSVGMSAKTLKVGLKETRKVPAIEMATEINPVTDEVGLLLREDVDESSTVLIKVETPGEELNGTSPNNEPHLNKDAMEVQQLQANNSEEGPSGLLVTPVANMWQWEQNGSEAAKQKESWEELSETQSPNPVKGDDSYSSEAMFDTTSKLNSETFSCGSTWKPFLLRPGGSPNALPGTSDLKGDESMISSLSYNTEPEMCLSWNSQGMPSVVSIQHYTNSKPDHRVAPYLDKVSEKNTTGAPLSLGQGRSKTDPPEPARHWRGRRFLCSYCGKRFPTSQSLETHVRVHTGERPYSCDQCGRCFTQLGHLKRHRIVHTGEQAFPCKHCGKRFADKYYLKIHQQKHQNQK